MADTKSELKPLLTPIFIYSRYNTLENNSEKTVASNDQRLEENLTDERNLGNDSESQSIFRNGLCCCRDICTQTWHNITTHLRLPSRLYVARFIALASLAILLWGNTFTVAGDAAGPEGQLFRLGVLSVAAYLAGCVVQFVGMPPLLGMLIMGIILRNIEFVVITGQYLVLTATLRRIALVIILIRAGLGLDPKALNRLSCMVVRLAIIPSLVEASSIAVMSHYLLDLPWIWGFLLGSVMAAVSPAVVIPCLFSLQDRGYGRSKGIPTLVIAAASFDDIIAISAFGVLLSVIFSKGDMLIPVMQGICGLIAGFVLGLFWGILIQHIPERNDRFVVVLRTLLLGGGGMLFLIGSERVGYDGAGPLGCIVAAYVACRGWKSQGWNDAKNPVAENFAVLWTVFQPVLFSIIGTEINLYLLDLNTVILGAACLAVSLTARILISIVVASGGNLNFMEKIFVSWAWFPKATVQAAIGPVALDTAREMQSVESMVYANKVLIVAVLAILITAPIGAALITVLGPRLLEREPVPAERSADVPEQQSNRENAARRASYQTTELI